MKWELKLQKVDELVSKSNATLYDRVKILNEVWEDKDYLAHHKGDIDAAEEMLDAKMGDYAIGFMEAKALLKHFPNRPHWVGNKLREMLAEALEREREERKEKREPQVARKGPVPRKDYEELEQKLEGVNSRADSLAGENGRLREELAKLRDENAFLRGRVDELERLLQKQFA